MSTNVNTDKNLPTNGKFYLYVRKSSESEDRRIESIQNQIDYWIKRAEDEWLQIVRVYEDEKSATSPNRRPGFKKVCEDLEVWDIDWILCWGIDRLSRNPVDTGSIQYLLQRWKIAYIMTSDRIYRQRDSWLLFNMDIGMVHQYVLDIAKNTKRWMLGKVHRWWLPWVAPRWYANDKMSRTIAPGIHEFRIVKRFWEMVLSWESPGNAAKLITQAIDVLGLDDTAKGYIVGKRLSDSTKSILCGKDSL